MKLRYIEIIKEVAKFESGVFKIPSDFIKDLDQAINMVKGLTILLLDLSKISEKGYVNDKFKNLPLLEWLLKEYKIFPKKPVLSASYSLELNIWCFQLILFILLKIVYVIEKWYSTQIIEDYKKSDLYIDIVVLRRSILRLITPEYRSQLDNKGLSIVLNSIVGYDSEYELKSSLKRTNTILSIQLAGNTGMILKIPIVDKSLIKMSTLNNELTNVCNLSISSIIGDIRSMLYKENDEFIEKLVDKLIKEGIKNETTKNYIIFFFPRSEVETFIRYNEKYSSQDLIKDSDSLNNEDHEKSLLNLIEILNYLNGEKVMSEKLSKSIHNSSNKNLSRLTYRSGTLRLSITINRFLYIVMHESAADLSVLNDFDVFKEKLNIIARSFITLGKPLVLEGCKSKIHIRDTALLAPTGVKSLAALGKIYGEGYNKIDIGSYRENKMRELLEKDKELFEKYGIRDSLITLKHATSMELFNFELGKIGVPLTLSGIGKSYVLKEWSKVHYKGYQPNNDIILGNFSTVLTPKGARSVDISNYIVPFISCYRGGRNESYMYGIDVIKDKRCWFDYDLTSCYTTIMSILGHPNYNKAVTIYNKTVINMKREDLILNYIVLDVEFDFPKTVKYPCIPTRVDDDVDIYPRTGRSTITGVEYYVALSMGCKLIVKSGVMVPFTKSYSKKDSFSIHKYVGPYRNIVKEIQEKRRTYPKKTFYNYMYKEIGNSVYGQIAMGISGKKSFDIKSNTQVSVKGSILANPILACYITGFTRGLIGECLNNIQLLGGKVVSATTDGFITDLADLEEKIMGLDDKHKSCLCLYKEVRRFLTSKQLENDKEEFDDNGLEIKNVEEKGLISLKTRSQLGFTEGGIAAISGFQRYNLESGFLIRELTRLLRGQDKVIEYIQTGLRGANEIYKEGGHVVSKQSDRNFSIEYDNRRSIIETEKSFLDSNPWKNVIEYGKIRVLKNTVSKPVFNKSYIESMSKSYRSQLETSVRSFIKACLASEALNRYGIPEGSFKGYKNIIEFVYGYEPAREVKISLSSISRLRHRNTISRTVPRTEENESFIKYVKDTFNNFEEDRFFKELSKEAILKKIELKKSTSKKS